MDTTALFNRIQTHPDVMLGKAVIKGTRLTVEFILGLLAQGASVEEVLEEYNGLCKEDIQACLLFASKALDQSAILPLAGEPR